MRIKIVIVSILLMAMSCTKMRSEKMGKYSHEEIQKAVILAISAKLEEKYHIDNKWHNTNFDKVNPDKNENDDLRKIDFIKRLKNNQDQKDIL